MEVIWIFPLAPDGKGPGWFGGGAGALTFFDCTKSASLTFEAPKALNICPELGSGEEGGT